MRLCFITVLILSISLAYSEVTIENGGYNMVVAFSQNVPVQTGIELISRMKVSLREASEILFNAIGFQFSKVTFEIPEFWDVSEYEITFEDSFNNDCAKGDILIDNTEDTVFGKFPFAHQYGNCHVPGHQITVPTVFFDDEHNRFPKGISLAREWLKYRYGVFDENGYFDDPLYPVYYNIPGSDANEVHVTECLDSKIIYNFTDPQGEECPSDEKLIDKLNSQKCVLSIKEEDLENVTSSFMYFQESITHLTHICDDDHDHNSRSPNKQNALCSGKSIGDIISQSSDFKDKETKEEHSDITFVLSKRAKQRMIVVWENTKQLESKGQIILNAIRNFMIDLPDGTKFNAFPFPLKGNAPDDYYTLKELDGVKTRKTLAAEIKSDFIRLENGNYKNAVSKAIDILKSAAENLAEPPGNIIIITGNEDNLIVVLLKNLHVCITTFDDDTLPENINDLKSNLPCLEVMQIPKSEEPEEAYKKLIETMGKICPSKVEDKVTEMLEIEYLKENKSLDIEVDNFTETVTFSIFGDKESDSFKLEIDGKIMKEVKEESYKNVLKLSYSPKQDETIAFSFAYPTTESVLVEVKKTLKPGKYFSGEILVYDTTGEEDSDQMPVIIYAIVRFGSYPVQNAKISAVIERPDGQKDTLQLLYDDGKGDPDITQNDGVYSRYYTNFSGEGDYTVRVLVKNNGFITRYGADKTAGYSSCCGSVVSSSGRHINGDMPNLNQFEKVFETTFTAKGGRPEDGYKPSRITDLRTEIEDDGILLKWTAPGGEADSGKVHSYEIKSFTSPEEATNNFDSGIDLFNYTSPSKERGETEELKINFEAFEGNGLHYIAMKAKNLKKESDLSTILEVYISTNTTDEPDKKEKDKLILGKTNAKTIGLIVGLIVGLMLLMFVIYVVIYFAIVKPKKKNKQKENPIYESSKRNDSNVLNPINSVSADILIKHHNEKMKAKTQNKEPPIFQEEDFEDRNNQSINESNASSNNQELESSHKNLRNEQPFPPKSPKRITPV